jgi:seryl-tRNA synthetase
MLDIRLLREEPEKVAKNLEYRGDKEKTKWIEDALKKDQTYRELLYEIQKMRHERNAIGLEISRMKKAGKEPSFNIREMKKLGKKIAEKEAEARKAKEAADFYLMRLPNLLHGSVPKGKDEGDNVVIKKWGVPRKFKFNPKSHVDIMQDLDLADMERAGKVAGARFYYLKGPLVLLEMALMRYAMDFLVKKGFVPVEPPFMIRRGAYEGVVDMGDFEDVIYKVQDEDLYLIATSEHPMASMRMGEVVPERDLPIRLAGISPCFRKEAGSHGKDTKGIFRVHQFNKVEQFVFCKPEESWKEMDRLVENVGMIFRKLEIPYRLVNVCTGDIGTVAAKKIDLEAWMPVQNGYREAASCANCTDYQARRLGIRYGTEGEKPKGFAHTLNATALATTRTLAAIMENFQDREGSVTIPKVLRQHMNGMKKIG